MSPYKKTPYNANVREFFTYNIEEVNRKRKEAEKINKSVCCG